MCQRGQTPTNKYTTWLPAATEASPEVLKGESSPGGGRLPVFCFFLGVLHLWVLRFAIFRYFEKLDDMCIPNKPRFSENVINVVNIEMNQGMLGQYTIDGQVASGMKSSLCPQSWVFAFVTQHNPWKLVDAKRSRHRNWRAFYVHGVYFPVQQESISA